MANADFIFSVKRHADTNINGSTFIPNYFGDVFVRGDKSRLIIASVGPFQSHGLARYYCEKRARESHGKLVAQFGDQIPKLPTAK